MLFSKLQTWFIENHFHKWCTPWRYTGIEKRNLAPDLNFPLVDHTAAVVALMKMLLTLHSLTLCWISKGNHYGLICRSICQCSVYVSFSHWHSFCLSIVYCVYSDISNAIHWHYLTLSVTLFPSFPVAELGDYSETDHASGYLSDYCFIPNPPQDFHKEVTKHHQQHRYRAWYNSRCIENELWCTYSQTYKNSYLVCMHTYMHIQACKWQDHTLQKKISTT